MIIFLRFCVFYWVFGQRIEIKSPKLPRIPNFILIRRKTTKRRRLHPTFVSVVTHQNDDYDVIPSNWRWSHQIFQQFEKISIHLIFLPSFTIIWLERTHYQKKTPRKRACFLAKQYLINWLSWQQEMTYVPFRNLKNTLDNCLKCDTSLVKISWTVFEIFSNRPPPPSPNRVEARKSDFAAFATLATLISLKFESQILQLFQPLPPRNHDIFLARKSDSATSATFAPLATLIPYIYICFVIRKHMEQ